MSDYPDSGGAGQGGGKSATLTIPGTKTKVKKSTALIGAAALAVMLFILTRRGSAGTDAAPASDSSATEPLDSGPGALGDVPGDSTGAPGGTNDAGYSYDPGGGGYFDPGTPTADTSIPSDLPGYSPYEPIAGGSAPEGKAGVDSSLSLDGSTADGSNVKSWITAPTGKPNAPISAGATATPGIKGPRRTPVGSWGNAPRSITPPRSAGATTTPGISGPRLPPVGSWGAPAAPRLSAIPSVAISTNWRKPPTTQSAKKPQPKVY
jgi:hypothetical protein